MIPLIKSPIYRSPRIFAGKLCQRLGLHRNPKVPENLTVAYDPAITEKLNQWASSLSLHNRSWPNGRVFYQDFDEEELFALCENGPVDGDTSLRGDIKLPWDFSRAHGLFLNGIRTETEKEKDQAAEDSVAFLKAWWQHNDISNPSVVTWSCAMEVAIRAVNWIAADMVLDRRLSEHFGLQWGQRLWLHGHMIWRNLEAKRRSSNHYIADLLGLFWIGTVLPENRTARKWKSLASREFPKAILTQTRADGGLNESSLPYHAFVTEMTLLFLLMGGRGNTAFAERLQKMCGVVCDAMDVDGSVTGFGDDDGGRVLPLDFITDVEGRAEVVLSLARSAGVWKDAVPKEDQAGEAFYSQSGWWFSESKASRLAVEFGPSSCGHAHNDTLSFVFSSADRKILVDPGSYIYTPDLKARNRFRSTKYHNTVVVDGSEQAPLPGHCAQAAFRLNGSPDCAAVQRDENEVSFITKDLSSGIMHRRTFAHDEHRLVVTDSFEGEGEHQLDWSFLADVGIESSVVGNTFVLSSEKKKIAVIESGNEGVKLSVQDGEYALFYGSKNPVSRCAASWSGRFPFSTRWIITLSESAPAE